MKDGEGKFVYELRRNIGETLPDEVGEYVRRDNGRCWAVIRNGGRPKLCGLRVDGRPGHESGLVCVRHWKRAEAAKEWAERMDGGQ